MASQCPLHPYYNSIITLLLFCPSNVSPLSYREHYVGMMVKVGSLSYANAGYDHKSRVSGVNTACVDHTNNEPSEWVSTRSIVSQLSRANSL